MLIWIALEAPAQSLETCERFVLLELSHRVAVSIPDSESGSSGVRALAELILRPSWSTVATGSELVATVEHNDSESHRLLSECMIRAASRMKMTDDSSCGVRSSAELIL